MADFNADPGDTLRAQFSVENTGDLEGTEDILLTKANGDQVTVDQVEGITLEPSGTDSGELVWETSSDIDADTYELCIESSETGDTDCVSVFIGDIADDWLSQFEDDVPSGSEGNTTTTTTSDPALTGTQSLSMSSSSGGYSTYSTTNGVKPSVGDKFAFIFQANGSSERSGYSQGVGWAADEDQGDRTIENGYGVAVVRDNGYESTGIYLGIGNEYGEFEEVIDSNTDYTPAPAENDQTWRVEVKWVEEETVDVAVVLVDNGGSSDEEGVVAELSGSPSDGSDRIYPDDGRLIYSVGYDSNDWYFDHDDNVSNV